MVDIHTSNNVFKTTGSTSDWKTALDNADDFIHIDAYYLHHKPESWSTFEVVININSIDYILNDCLYKDDEVLKSIEENK